MAPPGPEQPVLRARIEALERECGCQSGALAGFAALGVFVLSVVALGTWPGGWAATAAVGFAFYALAVGAGKHSALARAEREREVLVATLDRLDASTAPRPAP